MRIRKKQRTVAGQAVKILLLIPILMSAFLMYNALSHSKSNHLDYGIKPTIDTWITEDFGFEMSRQPKLRKDRFPSKEDRLKIYLSNWYAPPCIKDDMDERVGYAYDFTLKYPDLSLNNRQDQELLGMIPGSFVDHMPMVLTEQYLKGCSTFECQAGQRMLHDVCQKYFHNEFSGTSNIGHEEWIPVIMYFGKGLLEDMDIAYPFFASHRHAAKTEKSISKAIKDVDCNNRGERQYKNRLHTVSKVKVMSPIIWDTFYLKSQAIKVLDVDISWEAKISKAIWRGKLSGAVEGETFDAKCASNVRCTMVLKSTKMKNVDVGITQQRADLFVDSKIHPVVSPMSIGELLQYKMIIVTEGDGFATSLAWALYSSSVVIMPKPKNTSFLLEEKLEPWIHYIPVEDDFSDLEKKVKFVNKNSEKAKKISERATLWIHDLYMSNEAETENEAISKEIVGRYMKFFINENSEESLNNYQAIN